MSPVSVTASFATAPISPAFSSPIGSCSLPWRRSSWPIRSSSPRVAFQTWACEWSVPDRTRRYVSRPTNGSAVVLNTRTRSGPSSSAGTSTVGAALVGRRGRRLVGRGGEVADDRVEQRAQADPLGRAADEDRRQDRFLDALAQARLELGVGDLLALEVLGQDVVVGLGRGLEQLVAPPRDLVGHVVRDRDLDLLRAVLEPPRLAMDEVDVALERLGRADRELERRDLVAEGRAQGVERGGRVGVLAVALVDEEARRGPGRAAQRDRLLEARLDAGRGVHHEDRAVGRGEALDDVRDEVRVAGRVDERDPRPVALERRRPRGSATPAASAPRARSRGGPSRRPRARDAGSRRP